MPAFFSAPSGPTRAGLIRIDPMSVSDRALVEDPKIWTPRAFGRDANGHHALHGVEFRMREGRMELTDTSQGETSFFVLPFISEGNTDRVAGPEEADPALDGNDDNPDALFGISVVGFHFARDDKRFGPKDRLTFQFSIAQDRGENNPGLENLNWVLNAGLKLYKQASGKEPVAAEPTELGLSFRRAFQNRVMEVPGGALKLQFKVLRHEEPPLWREALNFITGDTGKELIGLLGLPALTTPCLNFLNQSLDRLLGDQTSEAVFAGDPISYVLTKRAREEVSGGLSSAKVLSLRPGFSLLVRGADYERVLKAEPTVDTGRGRLIPKGVSVLEASRPDYEDPFASVTYALLRIGVAQTNLQSDLAYTTKVKAG
ncbi:MULTISPECIES: hypothetical protein [unclassified Niveibacterium]|uniref:hypothetical protein n=1 Tax=unclassified Niveibacterium TaxID=2648924 RepID=UPI001551AE20|nr:hypothetical protein [Niveibacterium sp. COAC-50]